MPGNDFTDFLILDPNVPSDDPTFPATFKSNGRIRLSTEFTDLDTQAFKYELSTPPAPTVYRMRGYYVGGSVYEFWITTDPNSANPSGNPLINKVIDSIISCS